MDDRLVIAGKAYRSRLLVGTGKYRDFEQTRLAVEASGAEIVTVAIRRVNIGQNAGEPSLLDALPLTKTDLFVCRDSALTDTIAANLAQQCELRTL